MLTPASSYPVAKDVVTSAFAAAADARLEQLAGLSFRAHIERAFPGAYQWLSFREVMAAAFQGLVDGTLTLPDGSRADRLYFAAPPQSGKSTVMQLAASYLLHRFGDIPIGSAMHNQPKTIRFSKMVRKFFRNAGGKVDEKAIHDWFTADGGEFWAVGKGSSPSGLPAAALFTDDLLGGWLEANNRGVFESDLLWLTTELLQRETIVHPGLGRFIICSIGTLWSQSDIQAYLLSLGNWYVVRLSGICDPARKPVVMVGPFPSDDPGMNTADRAWEAPNCTVVADWRQAGEGLAPEGDPISVKMTASAINAQRRINGGFLSEDLFYAIIQQDPRPARGGQILPMEWFPKLEVDPGDYQQQAVAFDFGGTEGGGDASAWCLMARGGLYVIRHSGRAWKGPGGVKRLVAAVMLLYCEEQPAPAIYLPVALAEVGKIALAGLSDYLRRVASAARIRAPAVRGRTIRTISKGEEFKSPKHARVAYHGGSLAEAAEPKDWDREKKTFTVPGDVRIVTAAWKAPAFEEITAEFTPSGGIDAAELGEIRRLYDAIARHAPREEILAVNVDPGEPATEILYEFHNFSGYDGGQDNLVDAAADAKTALGRGGMKPWAG